MSAPEADEPDALARAAEVAADLAGPLLERGDVNPRSAFVAGYLAGRRRALEPTGEDAGAAALGALARLRELARNEGAAMDLWWATTGDDWPVPPRVPAAFLTAALNAGTR